MASDKIIRGRVVPPRGGADTNSDDLLRAVSDVPGTLVYSVDREGRFVHASRALESLLGVGPGGLSGRTRDEFMDAGSAEQHRRNDLEVMRTGQPLSTEETNVEGDAVRTYVTVKSPLLGPDGTVEGVVGVSTDITERNRAEEALRASDEEFRTLAEAMPQIVWATRPDGWNTYFNQRWVDYTGMTLDESYGEGWSIPFHPDDRQRSQEAWTQATATGGPYEVEVRLRRADGVYRWWLIRGVPLRDAEGKILKWFGTCTDVEDLKQTEAARQKFVMLADSSSDFIGMCDLDMKPLYVNPAGQSMVGLADMTAACQASVQDYFFPEDQQFIAEEFFPRVLREGHGDVEIRLRHFRTGDPIWVFYYLYSVRDDSGEAIGWATVSRDITERRRAEEQLAAQAARMKILADASRDFAEARTDIQAVIDRVTRVVGEEFGDSCWVRLLSDDEQWLDVAALYDTDPTVRDDAYAILTHERQPVADSGIASRAFQSGLPAFIPVITQAQLLAASPPRLWPLLERFTIHGVIVAPLRVGGRRIGVLGLTRHNDQLPNYADEDMELVQDLADRAAMAISNARLMTELEAANRDLEQRVQRRTEEYESSNEELAAANEELVFANDHLAETNQELAETNASLDDATRAKSEFLAAMSHELRTPLNSILGFSGTLSMGLAGPLSEEQAKQVSMISASGTHLLQLINRVLDLSKIEAGGIELDVGTVDVCEVARRAVDTLRPLAQKKALDIVVSCPEKAGSIQSDRTRVEQILLNLLGNAVKFTDRGHIAVEVSRTPKEVVFAVRDTGRGVPIGEQQRVFEEFYQASFPTEAKTPGTGLGLSVSRSLAEMLGGTITVESEPGVGSTFSLHLPVKAPKP